jgi:hypothetical protein
MKLLQKFFRKAPTWKWEDKTVKVTLHLHEIGYEDFNSLRIVIWWGFGDSGIVECSVTPLPRLVHPMFDVKNLAILMWGDWRKLIRVMLVTWSLDRISWKLRRFTSFGRTYIHIQVKFKVPGLSWKFHSYWAGQDILCLYGTHRFYPTMFTRAKIQSNIILTCILGPPKWF